ncbi:ARM repeat superfamily protein [Actinidia rufa]|uniref:ARM repeat superfamily protein n=1 Tax=Actinidia rufa TaxID=165716 RepID=A0A7J0ES24_9ERIC|nr:ARM repeat superfamily protein [Actinidia rufa]
MSFNTNLGGEESEQSLPSWISDHSRAKSYIDETTQSTSSPIPTSSSKMDTSSLTKESNVMSQADLDNLGRRIHSPRGRLRIPGDARRFCQPPRRGSGDASIAAARHMDEPICELQSCSCRIASTSGFRNEQNGGLVIREAMEATASTQAERTAESESRRRRRTTAESILERCGERASPCAAERRPSSRTHCLRTGDFSEESVAERQLRNGEKASCVRLRAIDSSSVVATASVSRSESLLRHEITLCLRSLVEAV